MINRKSTKQALTALSGNDVPTTQWITFPLGFSFILFINHSEITHVHDSIWLLPRDYPCVYFYAYYTPSLWHLAIFLYHTTNHTILRAHYLRQESCFQCCLFVCQDYGKTTGLIFMKFCSRMLHVPGKNSLNFRVDLNRRADTCVIFQGCPNRSPRRAPLPHESLTQRPGFDSNPLHLFLHLHLSSTVLSNE